jgi:hypothetical protein
MSRSPAFEAWVDEARRADCWEVLNHLAPHHRVKAARVECVGPCPVCGGDDRFSVNRRKNIFFCRVAGKGGDAIALAEYLLACDFRSAVEAVTGSPPPDGKAGEGPDEAWLAEQRRKAEEHRATAERDAIDYRMREIRRARMIWDEAGPIAGSPAEAYLRSRGVQPPRGAKLRAAPRLKYWHRVDGEFAAIHEGPALVSAIAGNDGKFIGCHLTYLAPGGAGKARIIDGATGEICDAKKVRGSQKGGHIHLGGEPETATRLILGEGLETVLSVREALLAYGQAEEHRTVFWASVNLGNMGGKAIASVRHPTLTRQDSKGRVMPVRVPGPEPDPVDQHVIEPPECIRDIVMLGDGDSDRFTTDCVLRRGAARWARPGRTIRAAWAAAGADFNDMLQRTE